MNMRRLIYLLIWLLLPTWLSAQTTISAVEYWYDGDYGTASRQTVSGSNVNYTDLLDVSSLEPGLHTYTIRFQDSRNVWGSVLTRFFTYFPETSPGIHEVTAVEYWLDGDYSSSIEISLSSGTSVDWNSLIDVSSLIDGLHTFTCRFKDDRGIWSSPLTRFFKTESTYGLKQLVALEYWYNNDYTNKVSSTFSATSLLNLNELLDVSSLPIGFQFVSIRLQDEDGRWGPAASWFFTKENQETLPELHQITALEYWYDGDYSSVQTDPVSASSLLNLDNNLDVSSLDDGLHYVSSRYRDEAGNWSPVYSQFFTKYPDENGVELHQITELQYWYDGDFSNMITDPVSSTSELDLNTLLDVSALDEGLHVVSCRFKDEAGNWSPAYSAMFVKYPPDPATALHEIVNVEYWLDGDYSQAKTESVSTSGSLILDEQLDVSALNDGLHMLSYRFQDEAGEWSPGYSSLFSKYDDELVTANNKITKYRYWADDQISSAIEVDVTTPVKSLILDELLDISSLPGGTHDISFQFCDSAGLWSSAYTEFYFQDFNPRGTIAADADPACTQSVVTFTAQTVDVDSIYWDFGDTTAIVGRTAGEPVFHAYRNAGDYTVTATLLNVDSAYTSSATTSITINQSYGIAVVAPENLVAYYPLDGDAGDASSFGHDGTIYEAIPTTDRNGNADQAFYFDGVNDYIDMGDWENGGAMSFTFWARWDAFNNYSRIVDLGNGSSSNNIIVANYQTGNNIFFSTYNNSSEIKYFTQALTLGQWDYFAATIDDQGEMKVYRNGAFIGNKTGAYVPNILTRTAQYIGRSNFTQDGYFKGAIDELKIYNKALSAEEILLDFEGTGGTVLPPVNIELCSNDLPYTFGSQDLIASGTYFETFQTVNGCDSLVQLNLIVNSSGSSTQYDTICESELPYTFGEQSLTSGGTFIENIPTGFGCDSLVTLHLVVNDTFRVIEAVSVCETELPYSFGNSSLNTSGIYTATYPTSKGCDSTVVLELTVLDSSLTEYEMSVCENDLPLIIGIDTFYTEGVYTKTLNNTMGCDSTVILTLNVLDTSLVTEEIEICESLLPFTFGTQSLSSGGVYTELFTKTNGCDSTVILSLTVNDTFLVSDAVTVCESELPFTWEGDELLASGEYTKTLSSANGCDSTVTFTLTVNDTSLVNQEVTTCESDLPYIFGGQTLTGSGTYTESFTASNGCDSTVILTLTVSDTLRTTLDVAVCESDLPYVFGSKDLLSSGIYSDTLTSQSGCDSIVVLSLTVNDTFLVSDEMTICESELPFTWEGDELLASGVYTKTLSSANGCDSTVTLTLTVNDTSLVNQEVTTCESDLPYIFGNQTLTSGGTYTEVFAAENGCDSTVVLTLNVNDTSMVASVVAICESDLPYTLGSQILTNSGTYTEVFIGENGCDSTVVLALTVNDTFRIADTLTVCENDLPFTFGTQTLLVDGTYTELFSSSSGCDSTVVLVFSVNDTVHTSFADTVCENDLPYILGSQSISGAGNYVETFADSNGCDSVVTLALVVHESYTTDINVTVEQSDLPYIFGSQSLNKTGVYTNTLSTVLGCDSVIILHLLVEDNIKPIAQCHSIEVQLSADGTYTLDRDDQEAIAQGSSDDISAFEDLGIVVTPASFTCDDIGDNAVTVRVSDAAGNESSCQTTIHVVDGTATLQIDAVPNQVINEDSTLILTLTGISGGTPCEDWDLTITAQNNNADLINSLLIQYESFANTATLEIIPVENKAGTDSIFITIQDTLGNERTIGFRITLTEVNDAPVVLQEIEDQQLIAEDSVSITISKIPGEYFEDSDDSSLVFSFELGEYGVPDWVTILEDEQQFVLTFRPTESDTGCFNGILSVEDQEGGAISDTFLICIDPLEVGISQLEESVFEMNLYPNPTRGNVNIDLDNPPPGEIELLVTSINGSEILRKQYRSGERIVFNLSEHISGTYLVILQINQQRIVRKIILDKK